MASTFGALGVSDDLVAVLTDRGIDEAFPIQELTIPDGLAGRDVCGKAKTGSGKTLAFGIPVIERLGASEPKRPRALALVPTRELALQVHDELEPLARSRDRTVAAVYGGANIERQITKIEKGADFIVATPGRLIDLIQRGAVEVDVVEHVVVDEADRMADMGFLPQVEWILRHVGRGHQTLLFSATLDGVVDGLVKRYQHDPVYHSVESDAPTVEEMEHRFLHVHEMDKVKVAAAIAEHQERTLIFVRTKRGADRLAKQLSREGVRAKPIHGDLRQSDRERRARRLLRGEAARSRGHRRRGPGIHVDEIDVVVHYDPPEDHKTYLHRSGRTARAGESGVVVTLVLWDQELEIRQLQKRVGIQQPLVEVFSNDPRLADLAAWDPREDEAVAV
ncbi:MAG: DEAD/DEAH box helicase [Acidimicrobiia bacterium]|nr:DEAD/DEAH box helicase [Acidimicrobiia bacterium]